MDVGGREKEREIGCWHGIGAANNMNCRVQTTERRRPQSEKTHSTNLQRKTSSLPTVHPTSTPPLPAHVETTIVNFAHTSLHGRKLI